MLSIRCRMHLVTNPLLQHRKQAQGAAVTLSRLPCQRTELKPYPIKALALPMAHWLLQRTGLVVQDTFDQAGSKIVASGQVCRVAGKNVKQAS